MKKELTKTMENIFSKGDIAPSDFFTGEVWVNMLLPKEHNEHYGIANVKFSPKARTHWHTHPAGQVLLVTSGKGYYQERGKPAISLKKGDIFEIPSYVEHWHGAADDSHFTHIALTNYKDGENVTWLKAVTDEEYIS